MNLCKDVCSIICSEATAYFLLDLYFSNASLARIVVVKDREIGKKCKLVVLYLIYAFLESLEIIMKLVMGGQPCLLCIFTVVNHPKLRIMAANCSG